MKEWWTDSMECYCYLRNSQDKLYGGTTPCERRCGMPFNGPVIPFGAMVEQLYPGHLRCYASSGRHNFFMVVYSNPRVMKGDNRDVDAPLQLPWWSAGRLSRYQLNWIAPFVVKLQLTCTATLKQASSRVLRDSTFWQLELHW